MKSKLFFGKRTLDELKVDCQSSHHVQFERLLKQAASYHDWLPPADHPSKSITFIGMASANLALAYALSGDIEYLETLRKWLRVAIRYPHWGKERMPDHDLDTAWLLFGLSLAYDWVGDALPVEEKTALRDKLYLHGQRLYDFSVETEGQWWSSAYWQNHNWICFTGLATAAYALKDEYPDTKNWSRRALDNFKIVFDAMSEDGSDYEGVVYWCYGVLWLLIYADLVAQQEDVNFYTKPFLENTFYFRLYMSGPNLVNTANFGDTHDRYSAHSRAMYYWFAKRQGNGYAQWLAEHFEQTGEWEREGREGMLLPGLLSQAFLDLLWYDPIVKPRTIDELPLAHVFPDLGIVSARTSWQPDATYLVFKSSVPLGHKAWGLAQDLIQNSTWDATSSGHFHPDENSFILMHGEDYLSVDEGYSKAKKSIQHNTVLIDGHGQYIEDVYNVAKGLDSSWGAKLSSTWVSDSLVYACGEAAGAYSSELGLTRFNRQVLIWNANLVLLCDDLAAKQPRQFEWLLQTDQPATITNDNQCTVQTGASRLGLDFISPDALVFKTFEQEVVAIPTSAEPDNIIRRMQYTLSVSPKNRQNEMRILTVLTITGQENMPFQVQSLDCVNGQAARINNNEQEIVVGFSSDGRFFEVDALFGTDARWLASTSNFAGKIIRFAVAESTRTFLNNQLWCAASSAANFLYREDGWQVQAISPSWVSLRIPANRTALFGNHVFESSSKSELIRVMVPAGSTKISLRKM